MKAVGLLVMMYPILCKVKYETLHLAFKQRKIWIQVLLSIFVNWIIAPFLMVMLFSLAADAFSLTDRSSPYPGRSCQTILVSEKV